MLEGGKVQSAVPAVTLHQLRGFSTSYRWHRVVQELPGFLHTKLTTSVARKENTLRREKVEALVEAALP